MGRRFNSGAGYLRVHMAAIRKKLESNPHNRRSFTQKQGWDIDSRLTSSSNKSP